MSPSEALKTAAVFGALGGLLLLIALVAFARAWRFGRQAARAMGTVVGTTDDGEGGLFPVVEFDAPATAAFPSGLVRFTGQFSARMTAGTRVPVLYSPQDPSLARTATVRQQYGVVLVLLRSAALLGGVAVVLLLFG
jgi:hypothetical protein